MITSILGGTATALAAVFLIPQISRVILNREAKGLSVTWAIFGVITNLAWVLYLLAERLWVPALAPALAVVTYGIMALAIRSVGIGRGWRSCLVYGGAIVSVAAVGGADAMGAFLVVTPAIQLAPQVVAVWRHPYPSGVSPTTWMLSLAEATCWGAYGHIVGSPALLGYGLVTSIGSALILGRRWVVCGGSARRQRPRVSSVMSTRPSWMAIAAASPRLAAVSLRRMFDT